MGSRYTGRIIESNPELADRASGEGLQRFMTLVELNPKWIGCGTSPDVIIFGLRFDCPHCKVQRLAIMFTPFIDPKGWMAKIGPEWEVGTKWQRIGDSFETITLKPSINTEWAGHWHGFIENGEIK